MASASEVKYIAMPPESVGVAPPLDVPAGSADKVNKRSLGGFLNMNGNELERFLDYVHSEEGDDSDITDSDGERSKRTARVSNLSPDSGTGASDVVLEHSDIQKECDRHMAGIPLNSKQKRFRIVGIIASETGSQDHGLSENDHTVSTDSDSTSIPQKRAREPSVLSENDQRKRKRRTMRGANEERNEKTVALPHTRISEGKNTAKPPTAQPYVPNVRPLFLPTRDNPNPDGDLIAPAIPNPPSVSSMRSEGWNPPPQTLNGYSKQTLQFSGKERLMQTHFGSPARTGANVKDS